MLKLKLLKHEYDEPKKTIVNLYLFLSIIFFSKYILVLDTGLIKLSIKAFISNSESLVDKSFCEAKFGLGRWFVLFSENFDTNS